MQPLFLSSLTLGFVVSSGLADTVTFSVCLAAFILEASLWLSLSSGIGSRGLLMPPRSPVGSSLNCTVYE